MIKKRPRPLQPPKEPIKKRINSSWVYPLFLIRTLRASIKSSETIQPNIKRTPGSDCTCHCRVRMYSSPGGRGVSGGRGWQSRRRNWRKNIWDKSSPANRTVACFALERCALKFPFFDNIALFGACVNRWAVTGHGPGIPGPGTQPGA